MADEQNLETPELTHEEQIDAHNTKMIQNQIDAGQYTLPEQFKSAEELIKSYKNMQGQATRVAQENARLQENAVAIKQLEKAAPKTEPVTDMAKELLKPANEGVQTEGGLDWDAIDAELKSTGVLSDGTQKAMLEANIPQHIIDSQVENHARAVKAGAAEAADLVGGDKELKDLLAWGRKNLNEEDQAVLADQLSGKGWKLALMGLQRMSESTSKPGDDEPKTHVTGVPSPTGTGTVQAFATAAEMGIAMRDKRYGVEKDFTEMVMARMVASQGTIINARMVDKRTHKMGR